MANLVTKLCTGKHSCGQEKSVFAFARQAHRPSGLESMCRTCKKSYKRAITKHVNAYNREYYSQHKEYSRAKAARRRVRVKIDMDDLDRQLSRAYRLAIANDPCHYCKQRKVEMQDDHKLALAAGGTDHWWNLTRACKDCNKKKFDKSYELFVGLVAQEA